MKLYLKKFYTVTSVGCLHYPGILDGTSAASFKHFKRQSHAVSD